jgi:(4S)-4-hydroxy-5-phosphonooxypentane-2,3-dione isomerase
MAQTPRGAAVEQTGMLITHVDVWVHPVDVEALKQAATANASSSVLEPGVARFDLVQQEDEPTHFVFVEAYYTADGLAAHKETAHYQTWRDTVAPMMARPRTSVRYTNVFPEADRW